MNRQEDKILQEKLSIGLSSEILSTPTNNPPSRGACSGHDVSMWFPYFEKTEATSTTYKNSQKNSARAKQICRQCENQIECLAYGLQNELWGIWGGFTERERKSLRRKFKIQLNRREPVINIQGMNIR